MRVDTLEAYNIAPEILAIWSETVGADLLPVQERAVKEFGLFGDANLIVFSPTSSGKTFVGEMAAVKAARENTKVFYLVPQKALAEEKFQEFRRRYGGLGMKVVVSSRDHREFDDEIERREFQIAVVVFEKMQALLVARPQLVEAVGLVVVDELQLITDETRGPTLELLLTKLRIAGSRPRLLGLSAVLGRAQSLADWLDAKLLVDTRRPVELRKGVLCRGTFTYREHNSGAQGTEAFADCSCEKRPDLVLAAAAEIAERGEQALVFLPDRASTVTFARLLASRVHLPSLDAAIEELQDQEETHAREMLREVLGGSVAFHNADLSPEEREIVVRHFRSGGIRVLFSTSTLAMGMNLPTRNVILDGKRWQFLRRYGRWSLEDIAKSEYENMSGRAGRLGLGLARDFGRSIMVTRSPFEAKVWLRHFVESDFEEIVPTLKDAPLENHVVNLLASGLARSTGELRDLLLSSFTGVVYWTQAMSREEFLEKLDRAVRLCVDGGLVREEADERLAVTDLGRACATKGIGVDTGIALAAWARQARTAGFSEIEALTMVSLTPAGRDVYVTLGGEERHRNDYRGELLRRAAEAGVADRPVFEQLAANQGAVEYEEAKALKKALFLGEWIGEVRTKEIERRFRVWAGSLRRVGEEYAWLVEALASIAQACGWPEARHREIAALSDRLQYGVRADALPLARLRVRGLGRTLVRRLASAGLSNADALRAAGAEAVRKALNHKGAFAALWAKLSEGAPQAAPAPYPNPAAAPETIPVAAEPAAEYGEQPAGPVVAPDEQPPAAAEIPREGILVVDLRERRVTYRGREIPTKPPHNLQRQPLLALAVLAASPGKTVTMADLADGMHRLGGLRKRPLTPDARDLRYKILRPFRKVFADMPAVRPEIERLVESVPGVGLRLNAGTTDTLVAGIEHGVPLRSTERVRATAAERNGGVAGVLCRGR
jgi:helicase